MSNKKEINERLNIIKYYIISILKNIVEIIKGAFAIVGAIVCAEVMLIIYVLWYTLFPLTFPLWIITGFWLPTWIKKVFENF